MRVTLVAVPYDLGRADVGTGRGPAAYLKAGAAEALRARGHDVEVVTARRSAPFRDELQAVLAVDEAVADAVDDALDRGSLPLVLAGNCNASVGVRAGLQRHGRGGAETALVWLDAHGDFNTPVTTETGYLDGMPLAMLCGRAHRETVEGALGLTAVPEAVVLHAGVRDLDREEAASLAASDVRVFSGEELRERGPARALAPALDALAQETASSPGGRQGSLPEAHLHVDLDVLDPTAAPGVTFPSPGGISAADLLDVIDLICERFDLVAVTIASFAPDCDDDAGTTLAAGLAVTQRAAVGARREGVQVRR